MEEHALARDRVSAALEQKVRSHAELLRFARSRHRLDPAELDELEQEVRLRLWRACRSDELIAAVSTSYVYRTAMSAAVDLIRRRRRWRAAGPLTERLSAAAAPCGPGWDATSSEQWAAGLLEQALSGLAPDRQTAVRMHLSGESREEIAERLRWSEARTRNLLYRGLADLRDRLRQLGIEA